MLYKEILLDIFYAIKSALFDFLKSQALPIKDFDIEILNAPHKSEILPKDKMALMIFIYQNKVLKIGIAGANSHARFQSQHYYPESSQSNLAKSLINDVNFKHDYDNQNIGDWIKKNCHRINIFISTRQKREILNQLKGFYSKLG